MPKKSFRDPTTHVLKAWGYMETNDVGDVVSDEADDFALTPGEWYKPVATWDPYTPPPAPDVAGFMTALKASMTLVTANTFFAQYPLAFQALSAGGWADFEELVIYAHDQTDINDALYTIVRDEAIAANIPITLPPL